MILFIDFTQNTTRISNRNDMILNVMRYDTTRTDDVEIGEGTKIWHFCHIQKGVRIGENCSFGQNVNISNNVKAIPTLLQQKQGILSKELPPATYLIWSSYQSVHCHILNDLFHVLDMISANLPIHHDW